MQCIIYVCDNDNISIYLKYNECARLAKRYGYSIRSRVLDFSGREFFKTVDKVAFNDDISCLVIYDRKSIGDNETALFYKMYLDKFGKKLLCVN